MTVAHKAAYLAWTSAGGTPGHLYFDAVLGETHRFSAQVTTNPVESGVDITDNVRADLDKITLEVYVSNSPIDAGSLTDQGERDGGGKNLVKLEVPEYKAPLAPTPGAVFGAVGDAIGSLIGGNKKVEGAEVITFPTKFSSVNQVIQQLRALRDTGQIIQVMTPHWDYQSMLITSVEMPRTLAEGDGAKFSIELSEIRVVESKRTDKPVPVPTQPRALGKKDKGAKGPVEADAGQKKTAAAALADAGTP